MSTIRIVKYRDKRGEFRAKIVARNGRVLFETSEGYKRRAGLDNAIKALLDGAYLVVDET